MNIQKTISFGKIAYTSSRKINAVDIEVTLKDGRLSIVGAIWNASHTDRVCGGQCLDTIAEHIKTPKFKRIYAIWKKWHLNDMKAGSPAQEAWLEANPINAVYPESHYDKACAALASAGLNPDPNYEHNGKPYAYGSAWLAVELPQEVVDEVMSW